MLSLPNDGRHPVLELAPHQRRRKTLEALIAQIEAIARKTPLLMIFEDAHWADPSSLEVFGRVVDKIDALRVLLFVTFRSEFTAPWLGRPHVTALTIFRRRHMNNLTLARPPALDATPIAYFFVTDRGALARLKRASARLWCRSADSLGMRKRRRVH